MTAPETVETESLQEQAHRHLLMHFTRNGAFGPGGTPLLVLERGEGSYVFDTEGNRYFDGLSSLFCCQIGYSYGEEMAAVASAQMSTLAFNTNWATAHPPSIKFAAALAERAPGDINRVFFTNGGSESVEAAWKIVRQHYLAKGEPQRTKAIAREIAYHGVTLGALSFTGVRPMKEPFGASPIPVTRIANTNRYRDPEAQDEAAFCKRLLDEAEATIIEAGPETVAMLIAEPVQNAGGCLVPPEGYWPGLRELCDRYGIALVADEVITGFGRIGEWFASARYGVAPDLITCAKGITSAYAPMGAVLVSDRIAEPLYDNGRMLMHGITFAGHPVAAAIALRNVEIFEREGVLENVRANEAYLGELLEGIKSRVPIVGDVRGAGYFWALELVRDAAESRFSAEEREKLLRGFLSGRLLEEGLIARPDDRGDAVLHLAPPLVSPREELEEMAAKTEAVLADASERFFEGVIHTAHGYWLEEAGPVTPARPLAGEQRADVVVIGGGYTGMWTAWQLRARGASVVVLEADVCGHGPSGRNGGFCETLWTHLPSLVERFGSERALSLCRASGESVRAIGAWCSEQGVDAWFTPSGYLMASTAPAHDAVVDDIVAVAPRHVVRALDGAALRARCDSPRFRRGLLVPDDATVQPARLALGLRSRLLDVIHEHSRVVALRVSGSEVVAETAGGNVRAGAAVLAVNAATRGIRPLRHRLSVTSSHIVLTEPVPDVLDAIGWTGGECVTDARTFVHYFRTTRDGRIAFGWGGGRLAPGARLGGRVEVDPEVATETGRHLVSMFPALAGRAITHAWGGPIDVSPSHLPQIGTLDGAPVHYAFGYTGNGVGPSHLAGRILADLVGGGSSLHFDHEPVRVPPEPLAWAGGMLVRRAFLRKERLEEAGRDVDPVTRAVAAAPRALGIHVAR